MGQAGHIATSHFSTRGLAIPDRFRAWRESIGVLFDVNPYDERTEERYFAAVDSFLLDDVLINHCELGAQTFARSPERIARDGLDHYQLHVFLRGSAEMRIGDRLERAAPGAFVNLDHGEPFYSETTDYEILNVFIPRRRLAPLLHAPDATHGAVFDSQTGSARLLRDYVDSLARAANDITVSQAPAAAEALIQLAALALNGACWNKGEPPELANHALLLRAQLYIKERLHRPDLTPAAIAAALGLSRSRLYRVFAPCGGVADYIREMRLRRCFTDLMSPRRAHVQIAQIAYDWGFKDAAHFSRLFKARFGAYPSEMRGREAEVVANGGALSGLPVGDTRFAFWIANLS